MESYFMKKRRVTSLFCCLMAGMLLMEQTTVTAYAQEYGKYNMKYGSITGFVSGNDAVVGGQHWDRGRR